MARALALREDAAIFSYAGRTAKPVSQPLPTRVGGFGGVQGLEAYLKAERITHVVDATHPFAAQMSRNAVEACARANVALAAFQRAPWAGSAGDDWRHVPDMACAVAALPQSSARVFLAIGKQNLEAFAAKPQHHYLLRLVDPPQGALPLPDANAVIARGPFDEAADLALLRDQRIEMIVAKNSGGTGARAKLDAARTLGIPVILIDRPVVPDRSILPNLSDVMDWLPHPALRGE